MFCRLQADFPVFRLDSVQRTETDRNGISAKGGLTNKILGYIATEALYRGSAT